MWLKPTLTPGEIQQIGEMLGRCSQGQLQAGVGGLLGQGLFLVEAG